MTAAMNPNPRHLSNAPVCTKRYLGTFSNHFSTIGLIGMNEVGLNAAWLKADLTDKRVQEFAKAARSLS